MDQHTIIEKVSNILTEVFRDDLSGVPLETELSQIKNFDSLEQLNLFLKIEQEFKTNFDMQQIIQMKTVGDIVTAIGAKE